MPTKYKHIRHQGPVIAGLGRTAMAALMQQLGHGAKTMPNLPGEPITQVLPPRPRELVRDYLREVGGDPSSYKGQLPPHLFPQWGFGLAARTLEDVPYPLLKVLNGGCRLEINAPLPDDEPLEVSARLESIDDNGRRAVIHQSVTTSTRSAKNAVVGHLYAIVPLGKGSGDAPKTPRAEKPRIPIDAEELAYWRIPKDAGLSFAALTGDFNPVHWIPPYAKAFGFRSTILHGFATMAKAIEGVNRARFCGATDRIRSVDVQFTKPLLLPAEVGLYASGNQIMVGDAPGGPAYLVGTIEHS